MIEIEVRSSGPGPRRRFAARTPKFKWIDMWLQAEAAALTIGETWPQDGVAITIRRAT